MIEPPPAAAMCGMANRECPEDVACEGSEDDPVPFLGGVLGEALYACRHLGGRCGVVDEGGKPAKPGDRGIDGVGHALLVADVEAYELGLAAGFADAVYHLLSLLHGAAADNDLGALPGEHLSNGAADPARGPAH